MAPAPAAPEMVAPSDPIMRSSSMIRRAVPNCPLVLAFPVKASWLTWRSSLPVAPIPFVVPKRMCATQVFVCPLMVSPGAPMIKSKRFHAPTILSTL